MKNILLACFFLIVVDTCFSQTTNTPDVIISGGGEFINGHAQVLWTIGDFQTKTQEKEYLLLTQGFLQSDLTVTGTINFQEVSEIEIKVFPNPVTDILNIQLKSSDNQPVFWELYNQSGQKVKSSTILNNENIQVDFSPYENGAYFIRTFTSDGLYLKIFKLVHLN